MWRIRSVSTESSSARFADGRLRHASEPLGDIFNNTAHGAHGKSRAFSRSRVRRRRGTSPPLLPVNQAAFAKMPPAVAALGDAVASIRGRPSPLEEHLPVSTACLCRHYGSPALSSDIREDSLSGLRPARTSSTICSRNPIGYGGCERGIVNLLR
jgi:hypothetical protein